MCLVFAIVDRIRSIAGCPCISTSINSELSLTPVIDLSTSKVIKVESLNVKLVHRIRIIHQSFTMVVTQVVVGITVFSFNNRFRLFLV